MWLVSTFSPLELLVLLRRFLGIIITRSGWLGSLSEERLLNDFSELKYIIRTYFV